MPGDVEGNMRVSGGAVVALAVSCFALLLGRPVVAEGFLFPDSHAYIQWPADFVLPGPTRVLGARPPGYALFLAVFGTGSALVWAQTVLSFAAWSFLGWVAGRLPGTIVGCILALAPPLWRWNSCVLSESFSLSLMALAFAVSLLWARRAAAGRGADAKLLAAWATCAVLFGWTRDANLVLVPGLLVPVFYLPRRWRLLPLLITLLTVVGGALDSRRNDRSTWSLNNAFLGRVLPDPGAVARFEAAGMPLSPAVREAAGSPGSRTQRRLRDSDPGFSAWIAGHGAREYWRWIVARPESYASAWRAIGEFHARDLPWYPSRFELPAGVNAAGRVRAFFPPPWATLLLPLFLVPSWRFERRLRPELVAALLAAAAALFYCFLCYHADAQEVHRHMLQGIVLQDVAFLVGVGALVALLFERFLGPSAQDPAAGAASAAHAAPER